VRLLILVSILLVSGFNAAAQTEQPHASPAGARHSIDPASKKTTPKSATETKLTTRLSRVCGQWAEYWRQKQLDKVIALYAPDAVFLTGTGDRFSGREAIRAVFKTAMQGHTSDLTPRSLVTEISGNLAYDSGDYLETIIPASGVAKTELKGNYVIVFKRQPSGKWLIIEHVWTDKPAQ
jgi:uncharacterized protein (TIGR02246 family)